MRKRTSRSLQAVLLAAGTAAASLAGGLAAGASARAAGVAAGSSRLTASCQRSLYQSGQLTVATDSPAYTPWFVNNQPSNGKGYESAVAYAVARQLGFSPKQVHWVIEPFNSSYAPGPKKFDFDINEISYTPARAKAVTFSTSYYDVTQALVALKHSAIALRHSPAELRDYLYGDQVGTTSLAFIEEKIRPVKQPQVFDTLDTVKPALEEHRIDAFVTDTPTAQYIASAQIPGAVLVGQFPSSGEHFGLLFRKGDPLASCVDQALAALRVNGTLHRLQQKWLAIYTRVPTIKP